MDAMTILVLEEVESDLPPQQRILETIPGVRLLLTADPAVALKAYTDQKIDVFVVDDAIADGALAFLKQAHINSGRRDVPTIVLTGNGDKDARRAAYEYGVYNVIEKPIDPPSYLCIARNGLSIQVMRRNETTNLTQVVEQYRALQSEIESREVQVIYSLLHAANLVDEALSRRMARVAAVAAKIAHRMSSISHEDARRFGIAARVYDIGFLALPGSVRERRLELAPDDAARLLGPHVSRSREVFGKDPVGLLSLAAAIAHSHHERFDGRGYPDKIKGHDISIYAQIVAVAETFSDAVTIGVPAAGRATTTPLTEVAALSLVERQTGTSFDPEVVEALRKVVENPMGEPAPGGG